MKYHDLQSRAPEQIFLIQGTETLYESLLQDISIHVLSESMKLSRFTKDDAATVRSFNLERVGESWLVIYFAVFQNDAAQSLLKTLEEPNDGIHIVFITPHPYLVPQTIRSRVRITQVHEDTAEQIKVSKKDFDTFIKEKLATESIDASEKRALASNFLDIVEQTVRGEPEKSKVVYEVKDMLYKANMPTKQVMEYLAAMIF